VVRFRLRAKQQTGSGTLRLTTSAGGREASIAATVSVRPAGAFQARLSAGTLRRGAAEYVPSRRLRPEQRRLEATISASPLALAVWVILAATCIAPLRLHRQRFVA
jgi:uncharacterized protein YfaS (alpha-2-macroglobulin family)